MPKEDEKLAAILAEMRREERPYGISPDRLRSYADRIEAAAKRERNAHTNDIHDALYKATGIPGNAAALRKALERIVGWCEGCHADACEKVCRPELTSESIHAALAALAAPARNCDRFKTAVEAMEEWNKYPQSRYKGCRVCPHGDASMVSPAHLTLAEWLFVTAEGEKE